MNVIMRCPRCKTRREITQEEYMRVAMPLSQTRMFCENIMCDHVVMLYHKDGLKIIVQGEEVF
jgi:hypothetical protein